jgi:hypothetical protein
MSDVQTPGISEREITIYATRGGQMKKIMTSATTWGELQPLVRNEGFDLSSLLAAENINKSDLVNDLAVLPTTAFRLFLRPKQTKSGAYDRKQCFAIIKAHLAVSPEDKAKFTIDGKNVTQLSTPVVQDLVAKYCDGLKATPTAATAALVQEKAPKAKAEKACETKSTSVGEPVSRSGRVQAAINLISSLEDYPSYAKAHKHLDRLLDEVAEPTLRKETEEEAVRREAREMGY